MNGMQIATLAGSLAPLAAAIWWRYRKPKAPVVRLPSEPTKAMPDNLGHYEVVDGRLTFKVDKSKQRRQGQRAAGRWPLELINPGSADFGDDGAHIARQSAALQQAVDDYLPPEVDDYGIVTKQPVSLKRVDCSLRNNTYQFALARGVSVSQIVKRHDDLARAISLDESQVSIIKSVPGTGMTGLVAPRKTQNAVGLSAVLSSPEWATACKRMALPVVLGLDEEGEPVIADFDELPHLLLAGMTGAGKSVTLNQMIISMTHARGPADLRFSMADPKIVELGDYKTLGLPHLMGDVPSVAEGCIRQLERAVDEMEKRYKLFGAMGVASERRGDGKGTPKKIAVYNSRVPAADRLARWVIVVDEFADFMIKKADKAAIEEYCERLGKKARAAGIYLLLATQRPDVQVITGSIKTSLTARLILKCADSGSAATTDCRQAHLLSGKGEAFFRSPDQITPKRVFSCFIEGDEVASVVRHLRDEQQARAAA